uniref:Rab-GAP TBC domain-containing protein n=1 Tax=Macrostomum lignano TaxID=282301 RepID=A0A1I8FHK7_9PLAT
MQHLSIRSSFISQSSIRHRPHSLEWRISQTRLASGCSRRPGFVELFASCQLPQRLIRAAWLTAARPGREFLTAEDLAEFHNRLEAATTAAGDRSELVGRRRASADAPAEAAVLVDSNDDEFAAADSVLETPAAGTRLCAQLSAIGDGPMLLKPPAPPPAETETDDADETSTPVPNWPRAGGSPHLPQLLSEPTSRLLVCLRCWRLPWQLPIPSPSPPAWRAGALAGFGSWLPGCRRVLGWLPHGSAAVTTLTAGIRLRRPDATPCRGWLTGRQFCCAADRAASARPGKPTARPTATAPSCGVLLSAVSGLVYAQSQSQRRHASRRCYGRAARGSCTNRPAELSTPCRCSAVPDKLARLRAIGLGRSRPGGAAGARDGGAGPAPRGAAPREPKLRLVQDGTAGWEKNVDRQLLEWGGVKNAGNNAQAIEGREAELGTGRGISQQSAARRPRSHWQMIFRLLRPGQTLARARHALGRSAGMLDPAAANAAEYPLAACACHVKTRAPCCWPVAVSFLLAVLINPRACCPASRSALATAPPAPTCRLISRMPKASGDVFAECGAHRCSRRPPPPPSRSTKRLLKSARAGNLRRITSCAVRTTPCCCCDRPCQACCSPCCWWLAPWRERAKYLMPYFCMQLVRLLSSTVSPWSGYFSYLPDAKAWLSGTSLAARRRRSPLPPLAWTMPPLLRDAGSPACCTADGQGLPARHGLGCYKFLLRARRPAHLRSVATRPRRILTPEDDDMDSETATDPHLLMMHPAGGRPVPPKYEDALKGSRPTDPPAGPPATKTKKVASATLSVASKISGIALLLLLIFFSFAIELRAYEQSQKDKVCTRDDCGTSKFWELWAWVTAALLCLRLLLPTALLECLALSHWEGTAMIGNLKIENLPSTIEVKQQQAGQPAVNSVRDHLRGFSPCQPVYRRCSSGICKVIEQCNHSVWEAHSNISDYLIRLAFKFRNLSIQRRLGLSWVLLSTIMGCQHFRMVRHGSALELQGIKGKSSDLDAVRSKIKALLRQSDDSLRLQSSEADTIRQALVDVSLELAAPAHLSGRAAFVGFEDKHDNVKCIVFNALLVFLHSCGLLGLVLLSGYVRRRSDKKPLGGEPPS